MLLQQLLIKAKLDINNPAIFFNKTINKGLLEQKVTTITTNSKEVKRGAVFIALRGKTTNGHLFIKEALKKGAVVVFAEKEIVNQKNLEILKQISIKADYQDKILLTNNTKPLVNKLCRIFYHNLPQNIVTITGTNGKTSVASMVTQFLQHLGLDNAQIGTTGAFFNNNPQKLPEKLTTPQTADLFKLLAKAKESNINHVAVEASSEGIMEGRLNLLPFNIAAFTNLSQDHLNYHQNMENYFKAKSKLFLELLAKNGAAIINQDDCYGEKLIKACLVHHIKVLSYGKKAKDLTLKDIKLQDSGYLITLLYEGNVYSNIKLNLLGEFQVYNLMCALLIMLALKVASLTQLLEIVPLLEAAKGRLELVREYNGAKVFVDYAHTPEALELALKSLRALTSGRLYVVFGCGGNRDRAKRAIMGRIASELADFTYITDDNPRNENPATIRSDIIKGFNNNTNYFNANNRKEAVIAAIKNLKPNDTLLVAGKGHEEAQIVQNKAIPYSDIKVILSV